MSKTLVSLVLVVMSVLSFGVRAEDQPRTLDAVVNLRHHAGNIYSAGQPGPEMFAEFAKRGVTDVINLRSPQEIKSIAEEAAVSEADMRYHNLVIADIEDLNRDNARQLNQLLAQAGNKNTLIHCKSSNRVGALMALRAAWLQGKNLGQALSIGKQYGLGSLEPEVIKVLSEQ